MPQPLCSVSLDLDNLWSYLKTHGDAGWDQYPSYLDIVVPRTLQFLAERQLKITWFVVGKDASMPEHHPVLRSLVDAGHEVGNHSFHHEPWLHLYSEEQIHEELHQTELAIAAATGVQPTLFRGPGFSHSPTLLKVLAERGYQLDASTFPTFLGPLARWYYFATARGLSAEEKEKRKKLFGKFVDGFGPLRPFTWQTAAGPLLEIPVTTMPFFKVPIHLSYLLYLGQFSRVLAKTYWAMALMLCRLARVEPSLLLHPLDFMGCDDTDRLSFFPAMKVPHQQKLQLAGELFAMLQRQFRCVCMSDNAAAVQARAVKQQLPTVPALAG